jgi:hypothetical protein
MSKQMKMGPDPTMISRKEVDVLNDTLEAVKQALIELEVDYILTGGSLLGAVRQHSILFCDDDIDIAIIEKNKDESVYKKVSENLQRLLGNNFIYTIRPWEGGDRIRFKNMSTVFIDLFTIRCFDSMHDFLDLIGRKKNGTTQPDVYVQSILDKVQTSAFSQSETAPLFPMWHFNTRKAVEMWPKEVYREFELFPILQTYKFGSLTQLSGPRMPVLLLKRAFGEDCFRVYYQMKSSHKNSSACYKMSLTSSPSSHSPSLALAVETKETNKRVTINHDYDNYSITTSSSTQLSPIVLPGGTWEGGQKIALEDCQYLPIQPTLRAKRRYTLHDKERLFLYLYEQSQREMDIMKQLHVVKDEGDNSTYNNSNDISNNDSNDNSVYSNNNDNRYDSKLVSRKTVYMDGCFDLFHIGHLKSIQTCIQIACGGR